MSERKKTLLILGLLLFAIAIAYWPARGAGLLAWDDPDLLRRELPESFGDAITGRVHKAWLPVTYAVLWVERSLWGESPLPYHLLSLLVHFANAALVLLLARRILGSRGFALAAALVFALHPLATESVIWISEQKGLLAFSFSALSILAFLSAAGKSGVRRASGHLLGVLALLLALLSKGSALVVPLVLLAYVATLRWRERGKAWWIDLAPYFGAAAAITAVHYGIALEEGPASSGGGAAGIGTLALSGLPVLARYARLLFVPFWGQSLVPDVQPVDGVLDSAVLLAVPVLSLVGLAMWVSWRADRRIFFGLLLAIVALAPFNNVLPSTTVLFAERYLYISLLGGALVAAGLLRRLGDAGVAAAAALVVLLGAFTFSRSQVWADGVEVFRDASLKAPESWLAATKLADALKEEAGSADPAAAGKRLEEAAGALRGALDSARTPAEELNSRIDLSGVLVLLGRGAEALAALEPADALIGGIDAGRRGRSWCEVELNRGEAYLLLGKLDGMVASFRAAAAADPGNARAFARLSNGLLLDGDLDGAVEAGEEAVRLDGESEVAAVNLARARYWGGGAAAALAGLEQFLLRRPGSLEARLLRGEILLDCGQPRPAGEDFRKVLAEHPGNARALRGLAGTELLLALSLSLDGRLEESRKKAEAALALDPRNPEALILLAGMTPERGEAELLLRRAAAEPGGDRAKVRLATLFVRESLRLAALDEEAAAARMRDALFLVPTRLEVTSRHRVSGLLSRLTRAAKSPGRAEDLLLLGVARFLAGDNQTAVVDLARVLSMEAPRELRDLADLFTGRALMEAERFEEAAVVLTAVSERSPEDPWPWIFLADCFARAGAREDEKDASASATLRGRAVESARRAVSIAPDLLEARLRLGEVELGREHYGEALRAFLMAKKQHPDRVEPLLDLAQLYKLQYHLHGEKHYLEEARKELSRALALDAHEARALAARGEVLFFLGRPGADIDLRRALQEDPGLAGAREILAAIYLQQARQLLASGTPEGEAAGYRRAQKAAALGTKSAEPHLFLAEYELGRKDFVAAFRHLQDAIRLEPGSEGVKDGLAAFHRDRGYAYLLTGDRERGLEEFREAIDAGSEKVDLSRERAMLGLDVPEDPVSRPPMDPELARLLAKQTEEAHREFEKARAHFDAGELDAAEEAARASLSYRSTANGLFLLGLVLEKKGDGTGAAKAMERAVRRMPDLAEAWLVLGNLRHDAGELRAAIEAYEAYLRHAGGSAPEETRGRVEARIREMRGKLDENR